MRKISIYMQYLFEYLKFGDIISIISSVRYLANKKSHKKDRVIRTSIGTFFCRKNTNDFQFANLMYEWSVKEFLYNRIEEFTVFIDGGACVGDYSILFSKLNLKCIAFEPIPDNFRVLTKNLELNGLTDKVKSFRYGLGDSNRQARFIFNPVNTGASRIDHENRQDSCLSEIRTFDSLLPQMDLSYNEKILVKLDAEGMEPDALRGSGEFIRNYPNITFVIEDKHSGEDIIKSILDSFAVFEYGEVDKYNIFARKVGNLN
jgi:FkbM family methyltransferase